MALKNFEKYENEIKKIAEKGKDIAVDMMGEPCVCTNDCDKCKLNFAEDCVNNLLLWLYEEYKEVPVLNIDEWRYCKALKHGWIFRNENGFLYVSTGRPFKRDRKPYWYTEGATANYSVPVEINENLKFDFITWEDNVFWSIENLLELDCEH